MVIAWGEAMLGKGASEVCKIAGVKTLSTPIRNVTLDRLLSLCLVRSAQLMTWTRIATAELRRLRKRG